MKASLVEEVLLEFNTGFFNSVALHKLLVSYVVWSVASSGVVVGSESVL